MGLLFNLGKSVKDKVILVLGEEWPLSSREIVARLKRHGVSCTHQAVYKSLKELMESGTVVKEESAYKLSKDWINSLRSYATYVDQSYRMELSHKNAQRAEQAEQTVVETLYDFYVYVLIMLEKQSKDPYALKVPCIFRALHAWNPFVIGKEEFNRCVQVIPKYNMYAITSADTPLDKALAKYWEKLHNHFRTGAPRLITNDVVVIGDHVVQIIYPPELLAALDDYFKQTASFETMDAIKFQQDIFYRKTRIPLITVKNKALADSIRDDTLLLFSS